MRALFLTWRDTANPEGGGSEVYVENVAAYLVAQGHDVDILCANFPGAAPVEMRSGVRFIRRGTKLGVHLEAIKYLRKPTFGKPDFIIDVQNGVPFFARPFSHKIPTLVLVHHVHREQWPIVYGRVQAAVGWWIESKLSPHLYRKCHYVTVSEGSRAELVALGVDHDRITVVYNGTPRVNWPMLPKSPSPTLIVLGRLVPHKRIELALQAAALIRSDLPDLQVKIVGDGWWQEELVTLTDELGLADIVEFTGFVDDQTKHELLCRAWVMALPSLKEGWGIVVMEAASRGVPTVAFREAGGVQESVLDGVTGRLVADEAEFTQSLRELLRNSELRQNFGAAAKQHADHFSLANSAHQFAAVMTQVSHQPWVRHDPGEVES